MKFDWIQIVRSIDRKLLALYENATLDHRLNPKNNILISSWNILPKLREDRTLTDSQGAAFGVTSQRFFCDRISKRYINLMRGL
jgi:hypothetical protein